MKHLIAGIVILGAFSMSMGWALGQEDVRDPVPLSAKDLNKDGWVNVLDLSLVASSFNATVEPNVCVEYEVYDDLVRPTATIVNSLGEVVENPRGYHYLVPAGHIMYPKLQAGEAVELWAC